MVYQPCYLFYTLSGHLDHITYDTSENIVGLKPWRNIIERFRTLSWRGNCAKPCRSSMKEKMGKFCNLTNCLRIVRAQSTRPSHRFCRGNIIAKNSLLCYIRNVQGDNYFYFRQHYGGCHRISSAKTFGGIRPKRHVIWGTTEMAS